ncbi:hypothetical protein EI94DRAFT_1092452 [Lactarius quietus]|nr:hypothetical protein EI94DRAFT_1092452 [Lactarius quietus]
MAYSIAVNTRFAGSIQGTFLDDLTSPAFGSFSALKTITKVSVYGGGIIDSVRITYKVVNAPAPITVQHGGPGGHEVLSFDISADEKLIAVYGTRPVNTTPWAERGILQLSFIVANSSGAAPTTKVYSKFSGWFELLTDNQNDYSCYGELLWPYGKV